jgi:hypothetical protein
MFPDDDDDPFDSPGDSLSDDGQSEEMEEEEEEEEDAKESRSQVTFDTSRQQGASCPCHRTFRADKNRHCYSSKRHGSRQNFDHSARANPPPPLFVNGERSKLTGRVQRGVGSGSRRRGCKMSSILKWFWRPSACYARRVMANRVSPDSLSRIRFGTNLLSLQFRSPKKI